MFAHFKFTFCPPPLPPEINNDRSPIIRVLSVCLLYQPISLHRYGDIRYHGRYHSKGLGVFNTILLEISGKKLLFFHFFNYIFIILT